MNRQSKEQFGIGVIGLGSIGVIHADVLAEKRTNTGLKLLSTADTRPSSKLYPAVVNYSNYKDLLYDRNIDAISICTPPDLHYSIGIEALVAGKHVLVEKPPALKLEELDEMAYRAKKSGLVLFTALHANYPPEVRAAQKMLAGVSISKIEVDYREDHSDAPSGHWLLDSRTGGASRDSIINAMSLIRTVVGGNPILDVDEEHTMLGFIPGVDVDIAAEIGFTVNKRIPGSIGINWFDKGPSRHQVTFSTERGDYIVDQKQNQVRLNGEVMFGSTSSNRTKVDQHQEYQGVYADFERSLISGESYVSTEELKFVIATLEKAQRYTF